MIELVMKSVNNKCCVSRYFPSAVQAAVKQVNHSLSIQNQAALLAALRLEALALFGVQESNSHWYLEHFTAYCQHKSKVNQDSVSAQHHLHLLALFLVQ